MASTDVYRVSFVAITDLTSSRGHVVWGQLAWLVFLTKWVAAIKVAKATTSMTHRHTIVSRVARCPLEGVGVDVNAFCPRDFETSYRKPRKASDCRFDKLIFFMSNNGWDEFSKCHNANNE